MLKLKKQPLESPLESAEEETRDAPFDRLPDEVSPLLLPCCLPIVLILSFCPVVNPDPLLSESKICRDMSPCLSSLAALCGQFQSFSTKSTPVSPSLSSRDV